jgi:hypothetical protein
VLFRSKLERVTKQHVLIVGQPIENLVHLRSPLFLLMLRSLAVLLQVRKAELFKGQADKRCTLICLPLT